MHYVTSNFYTTVYKDIDGNALYDFDDDNPPELQKLEEKFEKILQESLKLGEINEADLDDLRKINIEGILFAFIINKVTQGLNCVKKATPFYSP